MNKARRHPCTPPDVLRTYAAGCRRRAARWRAPVYRLTPPASAARADDLEARVLAETRCPSNWSGVSRRRSAVNPPRRPRSDAAAGDAGLAARSQRLIASSQRSSIPLHAALLNDPSPNIATALAQNHKLDAATYISLSQRPEGAVRAALIANPGVSPELLRRLSEDRSEEVVSAFAHARNVPLSLFEEFLLRHLDNPVAWYGALTRDDLSVPFLERVAREAGPALQQLLGQQSKLPASVFVTLTQRAEPGILTQLAMNALRWPLSDVLAGHADANVRFWAGKNPNVDPGRY